MVVGATETLDEPEETCQNKPAGEPMELEIAPYIMNPGSGMIAALAVAAARKYKTIFIKQNRKRKNPYPCVLLPGFRCKDRLASPSHLDHHKHMNITLPESIEARLSPESTALHLAIGLFVSEEATLGQAAEVAGLSQAKFLRELGKRRIPIHYGAEELSEDLRAVESLVAR